MTSEFTVAVHSLVYLNHKAEVVSSEALAENVCTNAARIRKVMAKLKSAGLVATKGGVDGGYLFLKDSHSVNLRMVAEALKEVFVSGAWKSGNPEMDCLVASGMAGILDDIYGDLNDRCLSQLEQISVADIDQKIFGEGPKSQEVAEKL